jgi:hypothetical protein
MPAESVMESYRATAFYLALWYAVLAALVAILLIALNDSDPATAFLIAANSALLFALLLMAAVIHLTDRRIQRGQFWRTLPPNKRADGEAGLRMARQALSDVWLRFAKGAAAVAIVLGAFAFMTNGVSAGAWAKAVRGTSVSQTQPGKAALMTYRAVRVQPTN